jgi:hypothetical protein
VIHYLKEFVIESHRIVSRFADVKIRQLIADDNFEEASALLGVDLVPWAISKYNERITQCDSDTEKKELLSERDRLSILIKQESRCGVCYEEAIVVAIPACKCLEIYCSTCIERWIKKGGTCPTCRKRMEIEDIKYNLQKSIISNPVYENVADVISKSKSKKSAIAAIAEFCKNDTKQHRVLIYSVMSSFKELVNIMKTSGICYQILQGNVYKLSKTLREFKSIDPIFLILNSDDLVYNMNLQECTEIIIYHATSEASKLYKYIQRSIRETPLTVYHFTYPQDMETFKRAVDNAPYTTL